MAQFFLKMPQKKLQMMTDKIVNVPFREPL